MFVRDGIYNECDTIFYQGINNTQTHALKYTGDQKIIATTGQLNPLKVI